MTQYLIKANESCNMDKLFKLLISDFKLSKISNIHLKNSHEISVDVYADSINYEEQLSLFIDSLKKSKPFTQLELICIEQVESEKEFENKEMNKNLKLPEISIELPIAHSGYMQSIILSNDNTKNWHFENIYSVYSYNQPGQQGFHYDLCLDNECLYNYFPCKKEIYGIPFAEDESKLIKDICDRLKKNYYCFIWVDEYYLNYATRYKKEHFCHPILIYGYDTEEQSFLYAAFDIGKGGLYGKINVFDLAFSIVQGKNFYKFGGVNSHNKFVIFINVKDVEGSSFVYSLKRFLKNFADFIFSTDLRKEYNLIFHRKTTSHAKFGLNALDNVITALKNESVMNFKPLTVIQKGYIYLVDNLNYIVNEIGTESLQSEFEKFSNEVDKFLVYRNKFLKSSVFEKQESLFLKSSNQKLMSYLAEALEDFKKNITIYLFNIYGQLTEAYAKSLSLTNNAIYYKIDLSKKSNYYSEFGNDIPFYCTIKTEKNSLEINFDDYIFIDEMRLLGSKADFIQAGEIIFDENTKLIFNKDEIIPHISVLSFDKVKMKNVKITTYNDIDLNQFTVLFKKSSFTIGNQVTVSSTRYNDSYLGDKACDGEYDTMWQSRILKLGIDNYANEYLKVDLSQTETVNYLEIQQFSTQNYIKKYELYSSIDNEDWKLCFNGEFQEPTTERSLIKINKTAARYFKFIVTDFFLNDAGEVKIVLRQFHLF